MLALAVNVVADVLFIKVLGNVYGAALASVCTLVASTAYGYVALRRYLPLTFRGAVGAAVLELKASSAGLFHKMKLLRL